MRIKPLIGGVVFNALGAYRVVMDILGDVDMIHTLMDKGSWLYAYAPILIGVILLIWAIAPQRKAKLMTDEPKAPRKPFAFVRLENCSDVSVTNNDVEADELVVASGTTDLRVSGNKLRPIERKDD